MAALYLLIPLAIVFVCIATALFFWAVEHNQFDDMDGAGHSILFDEPTPPQPYINKNSQSDRADDT